MPEEIYSPGLEGIIAGETAISTIAGGLQYRGYKIEDLAEHAWLTVPPAPKERVRATFCGT